MSFGNKKIFLNGLARAMSIPPAPARKRKTDLTWEILILLLVLFMLGTFLRG